MIPCSGAFAAVGDPVVDDCTNAGTAVAPCSPAAAGQTGAYAEALSPDGKQLYATVGGGTPSGGGTVEPAALLIFDRNGSTGAITRRSGAAACFSKTGAGGCTTAAQIDNPQDVIVSPDGKNVYVSNAGTSSIAEFDRAGDGSLSLKSECQGTGAPCVGVTGMGLPHGMVFDAAGANLYVRTVQGPGAGTLLLFDRASNGTLLQRAGSAGCWSELTQAGCQTGAGLSRESNQIAISPDGKNVYATGRNDATFYLFPGCGSFCVVNVPSSGSIAIFGRSSDGSLTQAAGTSGGCISNNGTSGGAPNSPAPVRCVDGDDALDEARSVVVSPDGGHVYVGAINAVVVYSRDLDTGALTGTSCRRTTGSGYTGCTDTQAVEATVHMAMAKSGTRLVTAAAGSGGAGFFGVDGSTGALTPLAGTAACVTQSGSGGCQQLAALGGSGSAVLGDDRDVYLSGNQYGALAHLHFDAAPVCSSASVGVFRDEATQFPLACSDRDGDPITLAISRQPFAGALGAIEQAGGKVFYSPFANFTGADSFEFTGTARGVVTPATVTLDVEPRPATTVDSSNSQPGGGSTPGTGTPPSITPGATTAAPSASVSGAPKLTATGLTLSMVCTSAAPCRGGASLVTLQHLRGSKVTGVSAAAKLRKKALSVGTVSLSIPAGKKGLVVVKLNRAGRALLARFHKFPAKLTVWLTGVDGKRMVVMSKKVVFKPAEK